MKRVLVSIITVSACLNLLACGNLVVNNDDNKASIHQNEAQEETIPKIHDGDKIITNTMEIVINSVELTYDVLPDDTSGFYTHYEADQGKVYICVDADVTNKAKQNLGCDEIGKIVADYNNGYTYRGFTVVDDSTTGFTYANITSIDPLETKGIKWLIACPQEVEESENPLFIEFTIDGEKFIYTIR